MGLKQRLLLIDDVDALGRSGEVVEVKSGYARNFLVPQQKAMVATAHTLRLQTRLKDERSKKANVDKIESEELAKSIEALGEVTIEVKVDPEGKLYGSVAPKDVSEAIAQQGIEVDKKYIKLLKAIKEVGVYDIQIQLKEEVTTHIRVHVIVEGTLKVETEKKEQISEDKA